MDSAGNTFSAVRTASDEAAREKAASISVFLVEELGDARVRCEQLKKYVDEGMDLIENSQHRDHFFETAGHLLHGIPEVLFKLEKALEAASMAASRIDYEEIKERLKPEKVEELEKALQDVRIRHVNRRSEGDGNGTQQATGKDQGAMNAKTAAYDLIAIADHVDRTGSVPMDKLVSLISRLEKGKREASASGAEPAKVSGYFRALAESLVKASEDPNPDNKPSRFALAQSLRRVVADQMPMTSAQVAAQIYQQANSREEVMKGFKEANPDMSEADLEKAADNWEKNKDVVKDKHQ
jgi:hypothetical protein